MCLLSAISRFIPTFVIIRWPNKSISVNKITSDKKINHVVYLFGIFLVCMCGRNPNIVVTNWFAWAVNLSTRPLVFVKNVQDCHEPVQGIYKNDKWQKARILHITKLQYGHECKIKTSAFMSAIFSPTTGSGWRYCEGGKWPVLSCRPYYTFLKVKVICLFASGFKFILFVT